MDLPSCANISTLIVLIFICHAIFKLQIYCRSHIFFILFCKCVTLHLSFILNGLNDETEITGQRQYTIILLRIYCHMSNNSICNKKSKAEKMDNSEKSVIADLLPNNNKLNKTGMQCEQRCTVVCSLWDSGKMGCELNRLTTFRNRQYNINCQSSILAENGFFYSEESSTVQCCRCQRTLSHSDDVSDPSSWHEEDCEFLNFRSRNYTDLFRQDQESEIHQQISERRRLFRAETAQNAAGSEQEGSLPQAASQSTDGGCLFLPSRDSAGASSPLLRAQTTSALERSPESAHDATFDEHLGLYSRTSNMAAGDCTISEPANFFYTEITPTSVTEGGQQWQSQAEFGHNTTVSVAPWTSTQTVGAIVMNLPGREEEIATRNIAAARTTRARRFIAVIRRRRRHSSGQQKCCCVS